MSKLVSMKMDPAASREKYGETVAAEAPSYPWGLTVTLDNDTLDKLGIELPEMGKNYMLLARVQVTRVSADLNTYEGKTTKNRSATLQITDCCLESDSGEGSSAADLLYGKG